MEGAEAGIQSCRTHSANDARFSRLSTLDERSYFVLTDTDGEKIGMSEMYNSASKRDKGIATCKADAASADDRSTEAVRTVAAHSGHSHMDASASTQPSPRAQGCVW
jgi:uncharacterized protein YegP (UPF0339 family)